MPVIPHENSVITYNPHNQSQTQKRKESKQWTHLRGMLLYVNMPNGVPVIVFVSWLFATFVHHYAQVGM